MNEIARTIREHSADIAEIESRSAGRPIRDIRGVVKIAEMFRYYAGWCDKAAWRRHSRSDFHLNYTHARNRSAWLYRSRRGTYR